MRCAQLEERGSASKGAASVQMRSCAWRLCHGQTGARELSKVDCAWHWAVEIPWDCAHPRHGIPCPRREEVEAGETQLFMDGGRPLREVCCATPSARRAFAVLTQQQPA